MGNSQTKGQIKGRQKKQVHWKAAERPSPPGKPQLVSSAELTPDVVTIRWDKPKYDGGSTITGYLVEHRRTGSPHWVRATPLLVILPELTLSGLEPGWRYQFRVAAQNAVGMSDPGEISEPLTVTLQRSIITAPKFTEELHDTTALENEMAEFIVHVIGQPPPKVCWFKDGFEIFSSRRTRIITENDKSVLTIFQVALSDEGEIKCTATNKAGHVSTKAIVKVEAPPVIRLPRQYEDGLLFELDEVMRLKVSIAGRPQPLIFWSHNGESIQRNDRYEIIDTDKFSVLKITEAKRFDRGEYTIRAVNKLGEDSTSFLVTVTDKPQPPKSLKVVMSLGKSVTLNWDAPEDDGGCKIGTYIVEYYRIGWNVWLKAATCRNFTTTLSDLIEGSEYKFRVKAESPYGVSDPSDETDVIFIPDPRRGLLAPPARTKSLTRENQRETSPVPPKRRSTSSTRNSQREQNLMSSNTIPIPPKRERIKSPQRSPESSPLATRKYLINDKNMFDRSSLARELSYGSPEIKYKKPEVKPPLNLEPKPKELPQQNKLSKPENKTPSPVVQRDRSPSLINQLLPKTENKSSSPIIQRERSPSIINQLLNILPSRKTPTPSPSSSPPKENKTPSPVEERKELEEVVPVSALKGDRLDRLSPNISTRRLSSPMVLDRDKSPSPIDKYQRNRSPSLGENLLSNRSPGNLSPVLRSKSPSPKSPINNQSSSNTAFNRSPSPSRYSINDGDSRRGSLNTYQNNNDIIHGSSEFMLVLVDDQGEESEDYLMFENNLIAPPMSLSAPELGIDSPLFMPLKTSVSSTELLHERAFARFVKEAEESNASQRRGSLEENKNLKVAENDERRPSVPKILINSKDNEEIVGLERKTSLTRRSSTGASNITQQYLWAKRRHSLRNTSSDNTDLYEMKFKLSEKFKDVSMQKSILEETEEIGNIQHKLPDQSIYLQQQSSVEESIYSEEEMESEDERFKVDLIPPDVVPFEEETYHPRRMIVSNTSKYEEPFEILTKPSPLPDPNFVPKPILKRKMEKKKSPEKLIRKLTGGDKNIDRSLSPLPMRDRADRSRTPSPSPVSSSVSIQEIKPTPNIPSPVPGRKLAERQMISAAEAAKNKRMQRPSSDEEYRVVADHYMDLVREFGGHKKPPVLNTFLNRSDVHAADDDEEEQIQKVTSPPKKEPSPVRSSVSTTKRETTPVRTTRREPGRSSSRTRNTSRNRSASNTRSSSATRNTKRNPSPCPVRKPMPENTTMARPLITMENKLVPKTKTRSRSTSRTRDAAVVENVTPAILQEKLNNISTSRTPSPRPLTPEQEAMQAEAEIKVRTTVDYMTDVAMFIVACWLYLFKDARLAIPILIIMVYRQLKDEFKNMIPAWLTKKKQ